MNTTNDVPTQAGVHIVYRPGIAAYPMLRSKRPYQIAFRYPRCERHNEGGHTLHCYSRFPTRERAERGLAAAEKEYAKHVEMYTCFDCYLEQAPKRPLEAAYA